MAKKSHKPRTPAEKKPSKPRSQKDHVFRDEDIDDEIDAFHKQRDVVPLDIDGDAGDFDDEMEQSVFDLEGDDIDDSDNSKSDDEDEDDDDGVDEEAPLKGFAAKIARQAKYLKQKFGGVDDEMNDEESEEDEEKRAVWGRKKDLYYRADNADPEGEASDEELLKEEETEVVKIQQERAKSLAMEDFGLEDDDRVDSDSGGPEKAFQDAFAGKKTVPEHNVDAVHADNTFDTYEEVKHDLSTLSKEEQMEVVYSSAPELVGLLTELDKALKQLKQVKSLSSEAAEEKKGTNKSVANYLEVKHTLLLTYCQAIGFYLLLKSEGHSVRDHPVIARLVEIKNLLEKMEQIDLNLPFQIEEMLNVETDNSIGLAQESVPMDFEQAMTDPSIKPAETINEKPQLTNDSFSKDFAIKNAYKDPQVGFQSMEMLKVRANLEAKLKNKGIYNIEKTQKHAAKTANRHIETLEDYDDDMKLAGKHNGHSEPQKSSKPLQIPSLVSLKEKRKLLAGDDDLPVRDDIGERRRKHELRVLARAGVNLEEEDDKEGAKKGAKETVPPNDTASDEDEEALESEDEFYRQVKKQRASKLMAKDQLYSRTPTIPNPSLLDIGEDDKRHITYQMEKNRGLTRKRNKLTKNPRKKYKMKHQKAVKRRKGQVPDIRKPSGPYGGEASGVNINVSRSRRLKS